MENNFRSRNIGMTKSVSMRLTNYKYVLSHKCVKSVLLYIIIKMGAINLYVSLYRQ